SDLASQAVHLSTLTQRLAKEQKEKLDIVAKAEKLEDQLRKHAKQFGTSSLAALGLDSAEGSGGDDAGAVSLSDAEVEKLLTKEVLKQKLFDLQAKNDALMHQISVEFPAREMRLREEAAQAQKKMEQVLRDKRETDRAMKQMHSAGGSSARNKSSLPST